MTLLAGKYRLDRVVGQGGMGVVVLATHVALDERVAIKLLLPEALASAETVTRFQREARSAVRIKSEHVARVSDVGVVDAAAVPLQSMLGVPLVAGAPFMVMEYLEGRDLAAVLRASGPLPVADATGYIAQAIEAIAEAHTLGIIHRDLQPANLFLTRRPDGTALVKVLDFGISKAIGPNMTDAGMTTTSTVLGSPMYMAPEQMVSSREVDGRTDVWALGVALYQLLTGHGPFLGTTMAELCARILQEPHAPMAQTRADVPRGLELVVSRCLEKDRVKRFASVADLAEALAPFGGQGATMSAERARRLIPRTERAHVVPPLDIHSPVIDNVTPYAATNPSWSATRKGSSSSSMVWIGLALALAGVVTCVAIAIFALAMRARAPSASTAPDRPALAAPQTTLEARPTELAPLVVHTEAAANPPPPVRTNIHAQPPPPASTTPPITREKPPEPPPMQKPDIF